MTERLRLMGFDLEWDIETGVHRWNEQPALSLWLESSVAGLMSGLHRMVGTERFNLCLEAGGRDSTDGDWSLVSSFPTFEDGFAAMSNAAATAGFGRWQLDSIDAAAKEARFRVTSSWESCYQRALGVQWGSSYAAGKFAGICSKLFQTNCWAEQTHFIVKGDPFDAFFVHESTETAEAQIASLLGSDKATRADLATALGKLQQEVLERQETERILREKLECIEQQEEAIKALSAPIIQVWEGVLALPLIGALDGRRALEMMDRLLGEIVRTRSRYTILDLTGVDVVDTQTADHLIRIVRSVELLGARSVITGIRPAVAQTMISLGMDLSNLVTLGNLQEGLQTCIRWLADGSGPDRRIASARDTR